MSFRKSKTWPFMMLFIALLVVIFFIIHNYWRFNYNKEGLKSESSGKVVFIIPSTSRNADFTDVESCYLVKVLYASLEKLDISKYEFVVGFDDNDEFYLNNIDKLKSRLPNNFHFHFFNNFDKSYVCIANQLANVAINEYDAEYIYIYADDLNVFELDYIDKFIDYFKANGDICLGWGVDANNTKICTHPFLHRKHVDLLGYFYPKEIKNWYCDDWATNVYTKLGKVIKSDRPVINNEIIADNKKRYDIVHINNLNEIVNQAVDVLKK